MGVNAAAVARAPTGALNLHGQIYGVVQVGGLVQGQGHRHFLAAERKVRPVARLGNDEKLGVVGDGETRRFGDEGGGLRNHFRVDVTVHPNIYMNTECSHSREDAYVGKDEREN